MSDQNSKMTSDSQIDNHHEKLISDKVAYLRPKLLDLTRSNPLISTKFSEKSHSLIRIIGKCPELMFESILNEKIKFTSLPSLESDPKDEALKEFQLALEEARKVDQIYLNNIAEINKENDEFSSLSTEAERALKDRVRNQLKMPPRQVKNNLSKEQHAKNNGISPSYELPAEDEKNDLRGDQNNYLQTMLLPEEMEKRLNALISKEDTWKEETGISVLHAAFGFLEWEDGSNNSKKYLYSPLILIPVQLEKKRTWQGQEFWITCDDGEAKENKVLAEKLRLEFNVILPEYTDQGLEKYLQEISEQSPKNIHWRVKRWAAIGVFPSARLAMYHDLDPCRWNFSSHSVISTLLGGSDKKHDATPFGDEYDIDEPEIENKVPYIIADADSSQFSTIVDVINGKNLAVEGPPGTGKSQTIVNTIAASLASGMKVLFVAEKTAALEVVRSRLEAFGVGNFLLPLLANRSSKEQVISSIRDRIEMKPCPHPLELDYTTKQFKEVREQLKLYVNTISKKYGDTDFKIHTILGRNIKFNDLINRLSDNIKTYSLPDLSKITSDKLNDVLLKCNHISETLTNLSSHNNYWKPMRLANITPFQANKLLEDAKEISELFFIIYQYRQKLSEFNFSSEIKIEQLKKIESLIRKIPESITNKEIEVIAKFTSSEHIDVVENFLKHVDSFKNEKGYIEQQLSNEIDHQLVIDLHEIKDLAIKYSLTYIDESELSSLITNHKESLEAHKRTRKAYEQSLEISDIFSDITSSDFLKVIKIACQLSRPVLSVRKKGLNEPSFQALLLKQANKARLLKDKKNILSEFFVLSSLPKYEQIYNHASQLSNPGIIPILSSDYRKAKKFYQSISKKSDFNKIDAAKKLKELCEWLSDLNDFYSYSEFNKTLEPYFDGIDSDFDLFERAVLFFNQIDENFQGASYDELRNFLKYAEIDLIQSLPFVDIKDFSYFSEKEKMSSVGQKIELISNNIEKCYLDLRKIKCLKIISKNSEIISLDKLDEIENCVKKLLKNRELLRNCSRTKKILGDYFKDEMTSRDDLSTILTIAVDTVNLTSSERESVLFNSKNEYREKLLHLIGRVISHDEKAYSALNKFSAETETKPQYWIKEKSLESFSELMKLASQDRDGLIAYSRLASCKNNLQEDGFKHVVEAIISENHTNISEIIEAIIFRKMAYDIYKVYGNNLSKYSGSDLNALRKKLQESDRQVIKLSRQRLKSELFHRSRPPNGVGFGKKSEYTELALLKNEISKKQRYIPVRKLTKRAAKALLQLKPCWMMSPLAVAQYLIAGEIEFDLVIIDEASQMTPEDSIGALIRAKQAMVVGDTNQLPPSGFFRKVLEDDEANEDEKTTEESILEIANACFQPARRLRWHYRSKNSSLISFSNRYVYNDKLIVFPSAQEKKSNMGVSYIKVEGTYSSGVNTEESISMVDKIINFMAVHKDKSLGVVLLNQKQRDLLIEQFTYALEKSMQAKEYVQKWKDDKDGLESFFIKNLENVQGDERDVIFIGTVYGPEKESGRVMQRFGPINGIAGKRRLNVLFSRAKERIVTFSSMTAADILADENANPGVHMLKCWLEYAKSGVLEKGQCSETEPDSAFEEHVIKQIESIGCEAIPQVGVKGYSIDIGVKHPHWPHGFIMGVECDGATYHSSRSARDRDRLRQEVLESLGWHLYRIWSTDWFDDPRRETENLRKAISARLDDLLKVEEIVQ